MQAMVPAFDIGLYLDAFGYPHPETFVMYEPRVLPALSGVLETTPLADLKAYMAFRTINRAKPRLGHLIAILDLMFLNNIRPGTIKLALRPHLPT